LCVSGYLLFNILRYIFPVKNIKICLPDYRLFIPPMEPYIVSQLWKVQFDFDIHLMGLSTADHNLQLCRVIFSIDTVTHTAPSIILSRPRQNWWFVYICLIALLAFKVFTKSWFFNEIKYKMQLNILFFLKNNFFAYMNKWFLEIIPNLKHI